MARGRALTEEDRQRASLIERLMCDLALPLRAVPEAVLAAARPRLEPLLADGVLAEREGRLEVTERRFLRHAVRYWDIHRHRIAPQVAFADAGHGHTLVSVVCNDRPGLMADIARVLREQRLRVHDARIATFGERAEDLLQITDESDRPLAAPAQDALREALYASLKTDA